MASRHTSRNAIAVDPISITCFLRWLRHVVCCEIRVANCCKPTPASSESVGIQEQCSGRLEEGASMTQFDLWNSSQWIESDHGEGDAFNLKSLGYSSLPPLVEALSVFWTWPDL